jgi:hypothetical protein
MALDFHDALKGDSTASDIPSISRLERCLDKFSGGNDEFWNSIDDPRWNEIRQMALAALLAIGQEYCVPIKNGAWYASGLDAAQENS